MNMEVLILFKILISILLGKYPEVGLLNHMVGNNQGSEIKTKMRYQLTPVRMLLSKKKKKDNKCLQGCERKGTHTLLMGMRNGAAAMENSRGSSNH